MTSAHLQQWIEHPELLNRDTLYELRNLLARYPYVQTLRLLYLKNLYLLHDTSFGAELRKSVLYVADRRKLFYLIEGDRFAIRPAVKPVPALSGEEEPTVDRTLSLIDAFLATLPADSGQSDSLPPDYATDYTSYLLRHTAAPEEETPKLRGQELIDEFLEKSESETSLSMRPVEAGESVQPRLPQPETEELEDDSCFTETLAKIYVKQGRYEKALEIIRKLSLKTPKKNTYFADQIRFLEKLIINANSK